MGFKKYKIPTIKDDDKSMHIYVCDKCGVLIKTDGDEPKKCPVCSSAQTWQIGEKK